MQGLNLWAPLKIRIPSLPRRREPSQINKLDSRLRGNDEFLEVHLCYFFTPMCFNEATISCPSGLKEKSMKAFVSLLAPAFVTTL